MRLSGRVGTIIHANLAFPDNVLGTIDAQPRQDHDHALHGRH